MRAGLRIAIPALLVAGVALALLFGTGSHEDADCYATHAPEPDGAYATWEVDGESLRIMYASGETRTLPRRPRRIVSTLPGLSETVAWLGGIDRLVAVSEHANYPEVLKLRPKVGVYPPDIEGILGHRPDVVLVDHDLFRAQLDDLSQRIPGLLPVTSSRSLAHLETSIHLLAALLGTPEAAERAEAFRVRKSALLTRLAAERPAVPFRVLFAAQWDPLYVLGPEALLSDLVRVCGGANIACNLELASNTFDEELVLARAPTWILHQGAGPPEKVRERWRGVPAIRDGRIASYDADDLVRAGPRILDGLERMRAVLLHEAEVSLLPAEGMRAP